jgi:transposase-like protein
MLSNCIKRRIHSAELKSEVLSECRRPGASVAAVAVAHGLNPNIVHKWLAGQGLKRCGLAAPAAAAPAVRLAPALQFVPVQQVKPDRPGAVVNTCANQADIRLELELDGLHLKLHSPATAGSSTAALLRAVADMLGSVDRRA